MAGLGLVMKKRLLFLLMAFSFLIVTLVVRVGWIQIIQGEELQRKASRQQNSDREITPRRGDILDRNGKVLATSISVEKIVINPQEITKDEAKRNLLIENLSSLLNMKKEDVLKRFNRDTRYEIVKKKVDKSVGNEVRKLITKDKITGVYIDEDTKRIYPNGNIAAHVLGFTGEDNQGLDGIEKVMENYLKGVPGKILNGVDAGGRQLPFNDSDRIDPQDGLKVVMTIDETIQHFATKALEEAIADNKVANGAFAIVTDPRNGDILAMVSKPDFNLNDPRACPPGEDPSTWKGNTEKDIKILSQNVWRNKCVVDTYEPGSTFKAITTAAGFEEGVVNPETRTSDRTLNISGHNINCWKPNFHGEESFREAVYNSCNPAFVKVALDLGVEKFYKYMRAFGFYDKTGISLPWEETSNIHKKPSEINMATASFGQRFTITPLQLIDAYGAIANGGQLMKPRLVKELLDKDNNVVKKFEPQVVRNVISKKTSETLRDVLEGVVSVGTGKNAYVKGYRVAGKTGTSETIENGRYIASFSAIAPADNPVICVLIALDNPKGDTYYGGQIAAPVAGKIIEDTLNYLEVERRYSEKDKEMMAEEVIVPDIRDKTLEDAKKELKNYGLEYIVEGDTNDNPVIKQQTPKPGVSLAKKSVVILYSYDPDEELLSTVPDVTDKTVEEATRILNDAGLNIRVEGQGTAMKQSIDPDAKVAKGTVVTVRFRYLDTH